MSHLSPTDNYIPLYQTIVWRRVGNKLSPETIMTELTTEYDGINWHMRMHHRAWKNYVWMIDFVYKIFDHPIIVILLIVYVKPFPV